MPATPSITTSPITSPESGCTRCTAGAVLFLLGQVGFKARTTRKVSPIRLGAAALIIMLIPVAAPLPALAAEAILTAVLVLLILVETVRFAAVREHVRHGAPLNEEHG